MVLQQGNKPLADHAGRAHNAYTILFHFATFLSTPRRPAGLTIPAAQPPWPKGLCLFQILCGKRPRRPPHRDGPKRNSLLFHHPLCGVPARIDEKRRKHLHSGNKKTGLKTGKICNIIGYCTVCTALHLPDSAPLSCGEEGDSFEPFGFETRQTVCRTACLRRNFPFTPGPAAWQPARNYS